MGINNYIKYLDDENEIEFVLNIYHQRFMKELFFYLMYHDSILFECKQELMFKVISRLNELTKDKGEKTKVENGK